MRGQDIEITNNVTILERDNNDDGSPIKEEVAEIVNKDTFLKKGNEDVGAIVK